MTTAKLQPALLGGVAIGVLSALPVINVANCCCAWILFGGALAAYLMQLNAPAPIQISDGAIVGLLAGLVGAFAWLIVSIPITIAMAPMQQRMARAVLDNAASLAPELRAFLESVSGASSPGGLSSASSMGVGLLIGFFFMLVAGTLFGMIGGLFGALMFRKSEQPVTPPPIPPADSF
jgi:hypothetical protein